MAKSDQIPPLLECRGGVPTKFSTRIARSRSTDGDALSARGRATAHLPFAVTALKARIGLTTETCVTGPEYIASREARTSLSGRDIPSRVLFVPIRDDSEMVFNLELHAAEAGLQRLGVAV